MFALRVFFHVLRIPILVVVVVVVDVVVVLVVVFVVVAAFVGETVDFDGWEMDNLTHFRLPMKLRSFGPHLEPDFSYRFPNGAATCVVAPETDLAWKNGDDAVALPTPSFYRRRPPSRLYQPLVPTLRLPLVQHRSRHRRLYRLRFDQSPSPTFPDETTWLDGPRTTFPSWAPFRGF